MVRVTYITCPQCKKEYYLHTEDYRQHEEAFAQCPFCTKKFAPEEGNPNPPLPPRQKSGH
jgi:uncharacterized CHY-type Zn-finger protein